MGLRGGGGVAVQGVHGVWGLQGGWGLQNVQGWQRVGDCRRLRVAKLEGSGGRGGGCICFGGLQGAGSCLHGVRGLQGDGVRACLGHGNSEGAVAGTCKGWSGVGVFARGWGAAGGWSCGCSASLCGSPGARVPTGPATCASTSPMGTAPIGTPRSTCPSWPGLGVPPTLLGLGEAPLGGHAVPRHRRNASGTLPPKRCVAAVHAFVTVPAHAGSPACPSCVPHASWGPSIKNFPPLQPPPSPTTMLLLACAPSNASPANFPASQSPASLRNYSAWQLPSLCELLCRAFAARMVVVLLILTRFPGLWRWGPPQPCQAASHRCTAIAQLLPGCWVAPPLPSRCTATLQPVHSPGMTDAPPLDGHCIGTAQPLHSHYTTAAWPLRDHCMASK